MTFTKRKFSVWLSVLLLVIAFALKMVELFVGNFDNIALEIIEIVVIVFGGVYLYYGAYKRAVVPYKMFFGSFLLLQLAMAIKSIELGNNFILWALHVLTIAAITMLTFGKDFGKIHSLVAAGVPFVWDIAMIIIYIVKAGFNIHVLAFVVYFLISLLSLSIVFNKYLNKDNRYERKGVIGQD